MKKQLLIIGFGALVAMSCENPMTFRTKVNEDGSLDKTIIFDKANGALDQKNIFDISATKGWAAKKELMPGEKDKFHIEFNRHFASADEMNKELDTPSDTLFHVYSRFEKKFRWFYTYIRYSETIRPINRFKLLAAKDFFNREDTLFVQRLPAEGSKISSADSVYLQVLNEKISSRFANMAIFKETFENMKKVITNNSLDKRWIDTLTKNEELIYRMIEKDQGEFNKIAGRVFDTLKFPFLSKQKVKDDFQKFSKDLKSRTDFMSYARDGKYLNEFEMPWSITTSNADSVASNKLYWRPMVNKFVFMDYEMYAECRKMNWWTTGISLVIVGFTLFLLWRKQG